MTIREEFEKDFESTFGPSPLKSDWVHSNAMQVDSAVWGQRLQGAKWGAKWMAEFLRDSILDISEIDHQQITDVIKELEEKKHEL